MKINVFGQPHQLVRNSGETGLMICGFIHALMEDRDLYDVNVQKIKQKIVPLLLKAKKKGPSLSTKQKEDRATLVATCAAKVDRSITFAEIRPALVNPDMMEKEITMYIYLHRPIKRRNLYMGNINNESTNQDPGLRKMYKNLPRKVVQLILNSTIADTTPSTESIVVSDQ